jgi:hypothetical protein
MPLEGKVESGKSLTPAEFFLFGNAARPSPHTSNEHCPRLAAEPLSEVRSGRGHESFLQGILGTRNLVHYLSRR